MMKRPRRSSIGWVVARQAITIGPRGRYSIGANHKSERQLAPHPSLKPPQFLQTLVRGVLPLGQGLVLDPFCGAGSALAAAEAVGYSSIGIEKDVHYFEMARKALPRLAAFKNGNLHSANL